MKLWHQDRLSVMQSVVVEKWLPGVRLLNDLSWNLVDTAVLEVAGRDGRKYVVKAAGPTNSHIGREIRAHESFTEIWASEDKAPRLVQADRSLNILMTEYMEGSLVEGTEAEYDEQTYLQAGRLLAAFHSQSARADPGYEEAATAKALAWLETPNRIQESVAERVRNLLQGYRAGAVFVVPTHGDWQPRNWLIDSTELKIIDFGRFDFRPATSDFCRLAVQQWRSFPRLEAAFLEGYGSDPRNNDVWNMELLREAISTTAWAYQVGDVEFEKQGHRMLSDALARF